MRVTFVLKTAGLEGGVRVVAVYAAALQQMGHEVTVVSAARGVGGKKRRLKRLLKEGTFAAAYPPGPSHLDDTGVEHVVLSEARPVTADDVPDADVVVATWWETAEWVARYPVSKGVPVYLIQHDERVFMHLDGAQRQRVEATWRLPFKRIAVAQWLAELLEPHGVSPTTVIPNAVDTDLFHARPREKNDTPTVGYMHSAVPFKGADLAKQAIEHARQTVPNLRVVAFGKESPTDGPGLPADTRYTRSPKQDELSGLYAACDAWLFASRCEGFGLPILEAMACRAPVIGVPTGAAPQLLADGAGVLVPSEDVPAMAAAIAGVAAMNAEAWRKMSDRAHVVATGYTWGQAAQRFEAELLDAVGRRRDGRPSDPNDQASPVR